MKSSKRLLEGVIQDKLEPETSTGKHMVTICNEEVVAVFCDEYCRFPRELGKEEVIEAKCLSCPFNRLF